MSRRAATLVVGALAIAAVPLVAGCGSAEDDYCSALRSDSSQFAKLLDAASPTALVDNLPMFKHLAGKAPDDIADDWQSFVTPIQGLADALRQAGVKPSAYRDGKAPAGLSASDRQGIADAADALSSSQTVQAAQGIDQEARDVCKVDLGM